MEVLKLIVITFIILLSFLLIAFELLKKKWDKKGKPNCFICGKETSIGDVCVDCAENFEHYKDNSTDAFQPLFDYFYEEHGITMTQSEMDEVMLLCKEIEKKLQTKKYK
jgi:hypothetical protein